MQRPVEHVLRVPLLPSLCYQRATGLQVRVWRPHMHRAALACPHLHTSPLLTFTTPGGSSTQSRPSTPERTPFSARMQTVNMAQRAQVSSVMMASAVAAQAVASCREQRFASVVCRKKCTVLLSARLQGARIQAARRIGRQRCVSVKAGKRAARSHRAIDQPPGTHQGGRLRCGLALYTWSISAAGSCRSLATLVTCSVDRSRQAHRACGREAWRGW